MDGTPQPAFVDVRDLALILDVLHHSELLMTAMDADPRLQGAWARLGLACGNAWRDTDNEP